MTASWCRAALVGAALELVVVLVGGRARADPPELSFPVDCQPGRNCWLYQYFDHDPGPDARDYMCGGRSYDGHEGTDIALADLGAMRRGVAVVAAAGGKVRNIRDGMPDSLPGTSTMKAIQGRECGNGVAISHGDGWETMYCHLRSGSVRVHPGETVEEGQPLGLIGLSGKTEFPHLHFTLRRGDAPVDPFVVDPGATACGTGPEALWSDESRDEVRYSPVDIYQVGFATGAPKPESAYAGDLDADSLPTSSSALVVWTTVAAVRAGDRLILRLLSPRGEVIVEHEAVLERNQIRYFSYAGRRRPEGGWPAGEYKAKISLVRGETGSPVERTAEKILTIR